MLNISFPEPDFQIRTKEGREMIFDSLRRKWLTLTPEEWVRQNFLRYLVTGMNYPAALIAQEKQIRVGELIKRFDILVHDQQHQPWMMVECKAPDVLLTESTLQQLLRYHITVPVDYLLITNGRSTMGWMKQEGKLVLLETMPDFPFRKA